MEQCLLPCATYMLIHTLALCFLIPLPWRIFNPDHSRLDGDDLPLASDGFCPLRSKEWRHILPWILKAIDFPNREIR